MNSVDNNEINFFIINEKFSKYLLVDKNYFEYVITNVYSNQILTLFSFIFFTTLYCCGMKNEKNKNKYVVVEEIESVKGEIV